VCHVRKPDELQASGCLQGDITKKIHNVVPQDLQEMCRVVIELAKSIATTGGVPGRHVQVCALHASILV
jgi:hypothetical protein